jgi:hypothetical protein
VILDGARAQLGFQIVTEVDLHGGM